MLLHGTGPCRARLTKVSDRHTNAVDPPLNGERDIAEAGFHLWGHGACERAHGERGKKGLIGFAFYGLSLTINSQNQPPETATFTWTDLLLFWERHAAERDALCGGTY